MDLPAPRLCPYITNTKDVEAMLKTTYGLSVTSMKRLNGYEDCNYHVTVAKEHSNSYIKDVCDQGYLVKFFNDIDSKIKDYSLGQKLLMDHLNSCGIRCQKEIKNAEGQFFTSFTVNKDGEDITYQVSVRTYLPGEVLAEVTLTSSLAYDVGVFTAKICKGLQSFKFELYDRHKPLWVMDYFMKVKAVLHAVTDVERKQVAEEVFEAFESEVIPRKKEFRSGQTHGDVNEQNILVEKTSSGVKICGMLDFQDSSLSHCLYDLILAVAYMMMNENSEVPIMDVGGHIIAGFESVFPLNKAERESLRILVAARMVMSLVYGAYFHSLDPSNDYLLTTSRVGWNNLLHFWQAGEEPVWEKWNGIIKSYNIGG